MIPEYGPVAVTSPGPLAAGEELLLFILVRLEEAFAKTLLLLDDVSFRLEAT